MKNFDYVRILPIRDTQAIFEEMGEKWGHLGDTLQHDSQEVDSRFIQWVYFCEDAKVGFEIRKGGMQKNTPVDNEQYLDAYDAFSESLKDENVQYPKIITEIESAFAQALSNIGREVLKKHDISPRLDVQVDSTLRGQVKKLIWGMESITDIALSTW